ncbi:serine hydrolase [Streptomyces sp. NPDC005141]
MLRDDDPLERRLNVPAGSGITLRHLARHTSGLPRLPPWTSRRDPYAAFDDRALQEILERLDVLVQSPDRRELKSRNRRLIGQHARRPPPEPDVTPRSAANTCNQQAECGDLPKPADSGRVLIRLLQSAARRVANAAGSSSFGEQAEGFGRGDEV